MKKIFAIVFFPCRQVPRWKKLVVQLIRIFFQSIIQSHNKYQSLSLFQGNSYWWRRRAAVFWLLIDGVRTWALNDILRCSWSTHITLQTLTLPSPPPPHEYEWVPSIQISSPNNPGLELKDGRIQCHIRYRVA